MIAKSRILIFGAGVIGSAYATKFIEAGFDVTLFARSNKFIALKEKGIQYNEKGKTKSLKVNVINTLEHDDVYDFIFVTVRYEQSEAALLTLKDNKSKNIVTMMNNSGGLSLWQRIIGDKLLPAFPGIGGQIKDGVLYARFPPKALAGAVFGEVNGSVTERIKSLAQLFEQANLPYKINNNMNDYLITHSVSDIAMIGALHRENKTVDEKTIRSRKTAHGITVTLKKYLNAIQKAGVTLEPSLYKIILKCPGFILDFFFIIWLRTKMVKDMLVPEFANSANNEVLKLNKDLLHFLKRNNVNIDKL